MEMKKVTAIVASSLLAFAVWLTPVPSREVTRQLGATS